MSTALSSSVRPINDRVSVTEKLDLGSIPCLAFSNKKRHREDSTVCSRQNVAAQLEDQTVFLLSPGQSNLVNTTKLQILIYRPLMQARHQDSATREAEINFGGAR